MKGNGSGLSAHFIWKIPPKSNLQARVNGERQIAVILAELAQEQEMHYGRAVMTAYLGSVVGPDLICNKAAAKAVWQFITGSNVDAGDESNIVRAMWAMHSGDKGIVLDMRTMNGKTKDPAFDPFFMEMGRQLESYKTVHSRRHNGKIPWSLNATMVSNSFLTCHCACSCRWR
jgi:hypothetical protein